MSIVDEQRQVLNDVGINTQQGAAFINIDMSKINTVDEFEKEMSYQA